LQGRRQPTSNRLGINKICDSVIQEETTYKRVCVERVRENGFEDLNKMMTPSNRCGQGYWVLFLEDCTLTIVDACTTMIGDIR